MRAFIFNEEDNMISIMVDDYTYSIDRQNDYRNGCVLTQETIRFYVGNYRAIKLFIEESLNEVNIAIYDDVNVILYQPEIEYNKKKSEITFIKVKTFMI